MPTEVATLAERAGGRLDTGGQVRLRVTGGGGAELAEVLDVPEGDRKTIGNRAVVSTFLTPARQDRGRSASKRDRPKARSGHGSASARDRPGRAEVVLPDLVGQQGQGHRGAGWPELALSIASIPKASDGVDCQELGRLGSEGVGHARNPTENRFRAREQEHMDFA